MIAFSVDGLPPKKDGANSMWGKPAEIGRLKALRRAAYRALEGTMPPEGAHIAVTIHVHADVGAGDLDNFITGICDGLQAVHARTPIDESAWADEPPELRPGRAITFHDDKYVFRILAERRPQPSSGPRYEVQLSW